MELWTYLQPIKEPQRMLKLLLLIIKEDYQNNKSKGLLRMLRNIKIKMKQLGRKYKLKMVLKVIVWMWNIH
jgi:hypothetical protein